MSWARDLLFAAVLTALFNVSVLAQVQDVTQPGDSIVATSNNSPGSEGVANAIDNQPTKYLNFDRLNTGFTVTPGIGMTLLSGLTLTSANDAVGGGLKGGHFGGPMAPVGARHFRPVGGVKAARKCAEGLALTPLTQAGT